MHPLASVVIPTFRRPDALETLLASLARYNLPIQIIVIDDGDCAETRSLIYNKFSYVDLLTGISNQGPAYQRNRGITRASCEKVFSFDDDVIIHSPDFFWKTLELLEIRHVGAVGIPFYVPHRPIHIHQLAPDSSALYVLHAFTGAAHAVRKTEFLAVGGYRDHFFYMGEEGDVCLRLLEWGLLTVACDASPVEHCESPIRVSARADYYGRRNDIVSLWLNAPAHRLLVRLPGTISLGFRHMIKTKRFRHQLHGMWNGLTYATQAFNERQPVSTSVFDLHYFLKRAPCTPEPALPTNPPSAAKSNRTFS